ncbi:MAG: hypothetical protein WCI56_03220 [Hyphomicrobiales bacterium]
MTALLIIATIIDLGIAILLIAVSGFIFGGGPESLRGDLLSTAAWSGALIACIGAPIVGLVLRGGPKAGLGLLIALLPPLGALLLASGIMPY